MCGKEVILNWFNLFRAKKAQKSLLKEVQQGDMVWARMPLGKEELEKVEECHRIRPYLVMWKDEVIQIIDMAGLEKRFEINRVRKKYKL